VKRIRDDAGNALLEGVSFAALAFGLVFSSGISLFQVESNQLALNSLARNVTRDYLLHPENSLNSLLDRWQRLSPGLMSSKVELRFDCEGDCVSGSIVQIELKAQGLVADSFGVISG
jgi:hypothetical protein